MSSAQDQLPPFAFGGIQFPVESYRVRGSIRDHVHEYSHQDGGDPELLGGKLYEIDCVGNFQATFPKYPGLWPNQLLTLVAMFEASTVTDLTVPSRGTFQAYALNWTQEWSAKIRSGEKVPITFRAMSSSLSLQNAPTLSKPAAGAIATTTQYLMSMPTSTGGLYDQLQSLVSSLVGIVDTAEMYGSQVAARVGQIISLCKSIDNSPGLQSPMSASAMMALHDVWAQAQQLANDLQSKNAVMQEFTVPALMSIQRISAQLFGDTSQVTTLLALNDIPDPLAIPAFTVIVYYPITQQGAS